MTAASLVGASSLRFHSGCVPQHKSTPDFSLCWRNLPLVILLAAVSYRLTGQYVIHRLRRLREEAVSVVKGTALMALLVIATTFGLHDPYESRATLVLFALLSAGSILAVRRQNWAAIRWLR